jgi:hypothetical protein
MLNFLKKDNIYYGLVLGLIAPILGMVIFEFIRFEPKNFTWFVRTLMHDDPSHRILSASLSISLIANALVFTYYINTLKDRTSKGILISTGLYGLIILLLKTLF